MKTDHRLFEVILKKPLSAQAPKRTQRMMLEVQRYDLTVVYRLGAELYLADTGPCLSCLDNHAPDNDTTQRVLEEKEVEVINAMSNVCSISAQRLQELVRGTAADPEMQQLIQLIRSGWPRAPRCKVPAQVRPYFDIRYELGVHGIPLFPGVCEKRLLKTTPHTPGCDRNFEEGA